MQNIKSAMKVVLSAQDAIDTLNRFARDKFNAKFPPEGFYGGSDISYNTFKVLSENKLEIKFIYGTLDGAFVVKL